MTGKDRRRPCRVARRATTVAVLAALTVVLLACGGEAPPARRAARAERVRPRLVVLSPGLAIICQDVGLEDAIVGRHDWDLALGSSIPKVGDHLRIEYEALLAVRPTHVVLERPAGGVPPRLAEVGAGAGFSVVAYPMLTLDDIASAADDLYMDFVAGGFAPGPQGPHGDAPGGGSGLTLKVPDPEARFDRALPSARLARAWSRREPGFEGVGPVLLLAAVDPPGAVGPGSFHHQVLVRIGGLPALAEGAAWQELDAESVTRLAPAGIVLVRPRAPGEPPREWTIDRARGAMGVVGTLDVPAVREGRLAVIDDPYALTPSTAMAAFADRLAEVLEGWAGEE